LRSYRAILSARIRVLLQYRAAALAGMGTQLFWGLIRIMIFDAFYQSSTAEQPLTFPEIVTWVWLSQALFMIVPFRLEGDLRAMISSGGVAYELLRPVDLYGYWFTRSLAAKIVQPMVRGIPLVIAASLFFGLAGPDSFPAATAFAVSLAAAIVLSAALTTLMTITLMWTISGEGISLLIPSATFLLSGIMIPLPLFPDWAQGILAALPFRGLIDTPLRLYLGHIPASEALWVVAQQLTWSIALIGMGRWMLLRGTRRLVIQGG